MDSKRIQKLDKKTLYKACCLWAKMERERARRLVILVLLILSGIFYYVASEPENNLVYAKVVRVLDGDTIEIEGGEKLRLIGVNAPEKGEPWNVEASDFLKILENNTVGIDLMGRERYGRLLGYVFYERKNMNKGLLAEGLANLYYYDKDGYYGEMVSAEAFARENGLGIWDYSPKRYCIKVLEFGFEEDGNRCSNKEVLVLENSCESFEISVKDDATHIFDFRLDRGLNEFNFSCVFNDAGDSLYVYDEEGLIYFERYA